MSLTEKTITAFREGSVARLDIAERPQSLKEAEAFQDAILQALGLSAAAWKLGASNKASQSGLGLARPFSGLLSANKLLKDGTTVEVGPWRQNGVECELAVRFRTGFDAGHAPVTEQEVRQALGPIHPALEIPQTRYETLATTEGPLALVADNGASGYAVLGPASPLLIDDITEDCSATLTLDGTRLCEGTSAALVDRPIALVTDHVNRLLAREHATKAGDYILLGSLTPYQPIPGTGLIEADFGAFGRVSVRYR